MSVAAQSATFGPVKTLVLKKTGCCTNHKGKLITLLVCAALSLMASGGLFYHFSIFKNVICYSLMGAGGVVGLGAVVTALILYQVCSSAASLKTEVSKPKIFAKPISSKKNPQSSKILFPKPAPLSDASGYKTPLAFPATSPQPEPRWNVGIQILQPLELLILLRRQQASLLIIRKQERLKDSLYVREMALNPAKAPKSDMPRHFNDDLSIAFRLGKDLNGQHVLTAQQTFQRQHRLRSRQLELYGCTHITLDPSLLTHKSYTSLPLDGCQFSDVNAFVDKLTQQKHLHTLSLGYEPTLDPSTFDNLMAGCPKLKHLTAAVNIQREILFIAPHQLQTLKIRIPVLAPSILSNILLCSTTLKHLTIWYTDVKQTDIRTIVRESKPGSLKEIHFIHDAPVTLLKKSHSEEVDGVQIHMTHLHTPSLFQSDMQAHEHNYWIASFQALLQRYGSHPEKLLMVLKAVTKREQTPDHLHSLIQLGDILAEQLDWLDWAAVELVFTPFALNSHLTLCNCALELLLRCALAYCQDKMQEKGSEDKYGSFFIWKSEVLVRILHTHRDIFLKSPTSTI